MPLNEETKNNKRNCLEIRQKTGRSGYYFDKVNTRSQRVLTGYK